MINLLGMREALLKMKPDDTAKMDVKNILEVLDLLNDLYESLEDMHPAYCFHVCSSGDPSGVGHTPACADATTLLTTRVTR